MHHARKASHSSDAIGMNALLDLLYNDQMVLAAEQQVVGLKRNLSRLFALGRLKCVVNVSIGGRTPPTAYPDPSTLHQVAYYNLPNFAAAIMSSSSSNKGKVLSAKNVDGHTPLSVAAFLGNFEVTELFLQYGTNPNPRLRDSLLLGCAIISASEN
jgi:ankyrin repeat protein